jgi:general nucleoside transport system ATP-binding protein
MSLLTMTDIRKTFPGVVANDHVSLDLQEGEVHALVGENGAGKTTLMKILYGLYKPDSGSIAVRGQNVSIAGPKDAIGKGIGMVHQHFMLVPVFSVLENIILGSEALAEGGAGIARWLLETHKARKRIEKLMEANGLRVPLDSPVEELPVGLQQRVEILKTLYRGADILVFDEPTAVLTPQEVGELFDTFRELCSQGKGIVFISHKLDEVLSVADRITVIRRGQVVETLPAAGATKPKIAELMVGKPVLLSVENPPREEPGNAVLEVRDVSYFRETGVPALSEISFEVRAGEIYGIAGVEGNGQSELLSILADRVKGLSGDVFLDGKSISGLDVRERREAGIAHIPEDRHRFGLILPFSLADNMVLGRHYRKPFVNALSFIQREAVKEFAEGAIEAYDIRTPSSVVPALALSGGNQQKAIIAREMESDPRLLLACQPTRGVDVGATEFIYKQLVAAKKEGRAVLLVSADLDEIMSLSDRIGVIYNGRITREFDARKVTKETLGLYMTGGEAAS